MWSVVNVVRRNHSIDSDLQFHTEHLRYLVLTSEYMYVLGSKRGLPHIIICYFYYLLAVIHNANLMDVGFGSKRGRLY